MTLPSFKNPPIVELALGVQFEDLPAFSPLHLGCWWQKIRKEFPQCSQQKILPKVVEPKDLSKGVGITIQFSTTPPNNRTWLLNDTGTKLIQIQDDRFVYNWRKRDNSDYPRYNAIKKEFLELLASFNHHLKSEKLGEVKPNICEITYVNHLRPNSLWKSHSEISKAVALNFEYSDSFLGEPESTNLSLSHPIIENDKTIGRLRTQINSVYDTKTREPIIAINVSAFGEPEKKTIDGASDFLDIGHKWTVKGFTSLTRQDAHKVWGKE